MQETNNTNLDDAKTNEAISFFEIMEEKSTAIKENSKLNQENFNVDSSEFEIENPIYHYNIDECPTFEYIQTLTSSLIPAELKMVKNSKRENSLCLLKAVEKDSIENEKYVIRMMRNSIWKETEESYTLVNVSPTPYKVVMTPGKTMISMMEELGVYNYVNYYQEHKDGPLFRVYYTNDTWIVSTSSVIYADGHWLNYKTFIDLFNETLEKINGDLERDLDKNLSYYFILQNPEYLQIIETNEYALYFREARNKEFNIVPHESVELPEQYKRLSIFEDWVVSNDDDFNSPSGLYSVVLKNNDTIRVSNWIYEELNNLKGHESHINNMIIHILRQPDHKINLFAYNFSRYIEQLNFTNYLINYYSDMLFRKYMRKNVIEFDQDYPLQKNMYYHVGNMLKLKKEARETKTHVLDLVQCTEVQKQGHNDYEWRENYVKNYVLSRNNRDISIIISLMKTYLSEMETLHTQGKARFNKENMDFWFST